MMVKRAIFCRGTYGSIRRPFKGRDRLSP